VPPELKFIQDRQEQKTLRTLLKSMLTSKSCYLFGGSSFTLPLFSLVQIQKRGRMGAPEVKAADAARPAVARFLWETNSELDEPVVDYLSE
jgi:hypothetical protein